MAGGAQNLAQLTVQLSLEGAERIKAGLDAIKNQVDVAAAAAGKLAAGLKDNLAGANRILERVIAGQVKPAVQALTEVLIKQIAQVKGITEAQAANLLKMEVARGHLEKLTRQTIAYGAALVENVQRKAVTAFTIATGAVVGLAAAGLRGSYIGDLFGFTMDRLGRVVGGLVAPEMLKIISMIEQFTAWIRQLDPEQKKMVATWIEMSAVGLTLARIFGPWIGLLGALVVGSGQGSAVMGQLSETGKLLMQTMQNLQPVIEAIAIFVTDVLNEALQTLNFLIDSGIIKWIAAAAAALVFARIASTVVSAIITIVTALRALTVAKIMALAFSGPTGWAQLAAGAVIAGAAIVGAGLMFNAFGKQAAGSKKEVKGLRDELQKASGFEDLAATWTRLASVSVRIGSQIAGQVAGGIGDMVATGKGPGGAAGLAGASESVNKAMGSGGEDRTEADKLDMLTKQLAELIQIRKNTTSFIGAITR